jgi:hypothetical protein
MSVAQGYEKIPTNGLVFMYDVADLSSYKGEPTTNLVPNADVMSGWSNYYRTVASSTFTTEFGTTGYRFVNQPTWNGIYKNFNLGTSGFYTFSAWFRYNGGSASNNGATVYISNYGGGDTLAALDKSKVGVWQRVTFTVNVTSPSNVYLYLISYGGVDSGTPVPDFSSWEVTMPQIELNSHATPFVNGTRSATQSLLPLVSNNTLDLSTVSFDSNGQIYFDGTDDTIIPDLTGISFGNEITIDIINNSDELRSSSVISGGSSGNQDLNVHLPWSDGNVYWDAGRPFNRVYKYAGNAALGLHHWVFTKNAATGIMNIYLDGALWHSGSGLTSTIPTIGTSRIGMYTNGSYFGYYHKGAVPVVKIYNREFTQEEVQQSYNKYKTRFNLS